MFKDIQAIIDKISDNRRKYQTWQKVVSVLACITVFCTTYALILPAITLESSPDVICGMEEHTHTSDCYQRTPVLICENTDPDHEHTDECYQIDSVLICGKDEHKHSDACFPKEEPTTEQQAVESAAPSDLPSEQDSTKAADGTKVSETTDGTNATDGAKVTETTKATQDSDPTESAKSTETSSQTEGTKSAETSSQTEPSDATEDGQDEESSEQEVIHVNRSSLRAAGLKNVKMMTGTLRGAQDAVSVDKTIAQTGDNSYEITMEAYATGAQTIQIMQSVKPTDIVLVLDQSGSMSETMNGSAQTKLDILKSAVNSFVEKVVESAKGADKEYGGGDDVNHRIAIVGFADGSSPYENTEIIKGGVEYGYGNAADGICATAFDSMDTAAGKTSVLQSIDKLTAEGSTYTSLGLELARDIFAANSSSDRNRVVVLFSDGYPGMGFLQWGWSSNSEATAAVNVSNTLQNTYNATVYSIGIFNGADRTQRGTAWNSLSFSFSESGSIPYANYFMHHVSSNGNNVPAANKPSYYLTPTEAEGLTDIFESIAGQVSTGGPADVKLNSKTTVVDIVSDYFELPDNADVSSIKVYTVNCNGLDANNKPTFDESVRTPFNATVTLTDNNKKISVKDFDFSEHWCGPVTTNGTVSGYNPKGQKLVIVVPVKPNDDFIGGYNVPSNGDGSGVYIDNQPVPGGDFGGSDKPRIDVPPDLDKLLPETLFNGSDLTIYAKSRSLTVDSLFGGMDTVRKLQSFVEQHSSELYQNTVYTFDIPESVSNSESGTYTVRVEVKKKSNPSEGDSISKTSHVYVKVPQVKWNDSQVLSGDTYTREQCLAHKVSENWVPDGNWTDGSGGVPAVTGSEPELKYTFVNKSTSDTFGSEPTEIIDETKIDVTVQAKYGDDLADVTDLTKFEWECGAPTHGEASSIPAHTGSKEAYPEFYIHAYAGRTLPATGGSGIKIWFIIGLTLMTAPIMIGLSMKRKHDLINVF